VTGTQSLGILRVTNQGALSRKNYGVFLSSQQPDGTDGVAQFFFDGLQRVTHTTEVQWYPPITPLSLFVAPASNEVGHGLANVAAAYIGYVYLALRKAVFAGVGTPGIGIKAHGEVA
jgi:hypothetical protein